MIDLMLHGLFAQNRWIPIERQKTALVEFGVDEKEIREIEHRDWYINKKTRSGSGDRIAVYRLFVIATKIAELQDCITRAHARGIYFDEVASGRRSDALQDLLKMVQDAQLAYGGKWLDPERASEMALKARGILRKGKGKSECMPPKEVERIMSNQTITFAEALAIVNADDRYPDKWSPAAVYRARNAGELTLPRRHNGKGW